MWASALTCARVGDAVASPSSFQRKCSAVCLLKHGVRGVSCQGIAACDPGWGSGVPPARGWFLGAFPASELAGHFQGSLQDRGRWGMFHPMFLSSRRDLFSFLGLTPDLRPGLQSVAPSGLQLRGGPVECPCASDLWSGMNWRSKEQDPVAKRSGQASSSARNALLG